MPTFFDALKDPEFRASVIRGLIDAGNRGAAIVAGAPVDAATQAANLGVAGVGYVGHKTGLMKTPPNLIDPATVPGSSEWIGRRMEQGGFVSADRNPTAEVLASLAIPMAAARVGPSLFAAEQRAAQNLAAPRTMPMRGERGAVAWHGTPHKFDKFDPSKIGTGEGAQAFGHGLYFAQSKDVASGYRARLSPKAGAVNTHLDKNISSIIDEAIKALPKQYHDQIFSRIPAMKGFLSGNSWHGAAIQMQKKAEKSKGVMKALLESDAKLAKAIGEAGVENSLSGRLYKVDVDDNVISRMIDWDAGGAEVWRSALRDAGGKPDVASSLLSSRGITGVKYLDSGSRGKAAGTTNYVVFPSHADAVKIIDIE